MCSHLVSEKGRGDYMLTAEVIAKRLVKLRGSKTQAMVASEIGISATAYANYESALRIPRDETKVKIATYFGTTVQSLFFE